jgi:hypothetical protein
MRKHSPDRAETLVESATATLEKKALPVSGLDASTHLLSAQVAIGAGNDDRKLLVLELEDILLRYSLLPD